MMLGTAGFTALLCSFAVKAKEELLLGEKVKDVLVTGATGGVGSIAVMILSKMGYDVHAVTGKKDKNDYLKSLGAKNIIERKEFEGESKLLEKGVWDGVVDTVSRWCCFNKNICTNKTWWNSCCVWKCRGNKNQHKCNAFYYKRSKTMGYRFVWFLNKTKGVCLGRSSQID